MHYCAGTVLILLAFCVTIKSDCVVNTETADEYVNCTNVETIPLTQMNAHWKKIYVVNGPDQNFSITGTSNPYIESVTELNLAEAGKLKLSPKGFQRFLSLTFLTISHNSINRLYGTWFLLHNRIEYLDANYNPVKFLKPDSLNTLSKLIELKLSYNTIDEVKTNAFNGLSALESLYLKGNRIQSFSNIGTLAKLKLLDLSDNVIKTINATTFATVTSLEKLYLQGNQIDSLQPKCFADLSQLKLLDLGYNRLTRFHSNLFSEFSTVKLEDLTLSSNHIDHIEPEAFSRLNNLKYLDLSRNRLLGLNASTFAGLTGLKRLTIQHNQLFHLQPGCFMVFTLLEHLDLGGNRLQTLNNSVFGGPLPRLKRIFVNLNFLRDIAPDTFIYTPSVDYLSVSNNELNAVNADWFAPLPKLRKLHIAFNHIEVLPETMFNYMPELEQFFMNNNRIAFFPDHDEGTLTHLQQISLEVNPWECECLETFQRWLTEKQVNYRNKANPRYDGKKPICVAVPEGECVKNIDAVKELEIVDIFESATKPKKSFADFIVA